MRRPDVLRKDKDFADMYRRKKASAGKYVVVFYRKNQLPYNRKAFLASKKVGKSVQRNRARRLMRESYRQMEHLLPTGWDFIFIARHTILDMKCADVKKSMETAMKKAGIIK